jgi:hypothetical protein
MRVWRIILASAGIALGLFGVGRLVTQIPAYSLQWLAVWLILAVVIHDGVLSPLVVTVGWFLRRRMPPRARRYLQAGLIMGSMVTVIAVPMIYLRGSQPASKAILDQDYGGHLALLLGVVAGGTLIAYAVRVARDQTARGRLVERHGGGPIDGA